MIDWNAWPTRALETIQNGLLRRALMESIRAMEEQRVMPTELLFGRGMSNFWWTIAMNRARYMHHPNMIERDQFFGMPIMHSAFPDPTPSRNDQALGLDFDSEIRLVARGFGSMPCRMQVLNNPLRMNYEVVVVGADNYVRRDILSYTHVHEQMRRERAVAPQENIANPMQFDEVLTKKDPVQPWMTPTRIAWLT
jgi:hypothetical protein